MPLGGDILLAVKGSRAYWQNMGSRKSVWFMEDEIVLHGTPISYDVCNDTIKPGVSLHLVDSSAGTSALGDLVQLKSGFIRMIAISVPN